MTNIQNHDPSLPTDDLPLPPAREEEESEGIDSPLESDESSEQTGLKFRDGEEIRLVKVRFPGNPKSFSFFIGQESYAYGQQIVALSDRGLAIGRITSLPFLKKYHKNFGTVQPLLRVATDEDFRNEAAHEEKKRRLQDICRKHIESLKLEMDLTHVEFTQGGNKVIFYFTAPARVDFRQLVKNLVAEIKSRIELRQIYIRDRAAGVGGVGPCGRPQCCSTFLQKYGHVNIKMAKNQSITLSPTKLNGCCGQLKCCLQYEDEVYSEKRQRLPDEGSLIETLNGDRGRVQRLHVLKEEFEMMTDRGQLRRYGSGQFSPEKGRSGNWSMPDQFDTIMDERETLIQ